jgi:hypothetical protein
MTPKGHMTKDIEPHRRRLQRIRVLWGCYTVNAFSITSIDDFAAAAAALTAGVTAGIVSDLGSDGWVFSQYDHLTLTVTLQMANRYSKGK